MPVDRLSVRWSFLFLTPAARVYVCMDFFLCTFRLDDKVDYKIVVFSFMWIQESAEISFVIFFANVLFVSISDWNKNSVRCFIDFLKKQNEKKETLCNRWEWQSGEYFVHLLGPLEILMDSQTMTLSAYGMELPFRQSVAKIPSERTAQVSGIRWTRTNNITKNNCWLSREKNFIDRDSHSRCSSTWKSEVFFSSLSLSWKRKKGDKNYFYDQYFRSIEQECLSDSYVLFSLFSVDT